jgi:hypothetical protein
MSLASTAASWTSDNQTKKRVPTMKRMTAKIRPYDNPSSSEPVGYNMDELPTSNEEQAQTIKNMMDKLTTNEESDTLSDFNPIQPPALASKNAEIENTYMNSSTLMPKTIAKQQNDYVLNDAHLGKLSNYAQSYTNAVNNKPYYNASPIGDSNNKLMEKLNYMIHLLEQQQYEKTSNMTEEFILYIFLGVFVIFTIDSFNKAGKYVR